jgi:hypothetical protein
MDRVFEPNLELISEFVDEDRRRMFLWSFVDFVDTDKDRRYAWPSLNIDRPVLCTSIFHWYEIYNGLATVCSTIYSSKYPRILRWFSFPPTHKTRAGYVHSPRATLISGIDIRNTHGPALVADVKLAIRVTENDSLLLWNFRLTEIQIITIMRRV